MVVEKSIKTVREFLADSTLAIPEYQRPYNWTTRNVKQLFKDIIRQASRPGAYRLGTIVLYWDGTKNNIVDGQQRTVTLVLTIHALCEKEGIDEKLKDLKEKMITPEFSSDISKKNIYKNYQKIKKIIKRDNFNDKVIKFLLDKCEVATFILSDVSEAFQFFDSQNARGQELTGYDLLKAYHINKETNKENSEELIKGWENAIDENKMASLFNYLFRIRKWANKPDGEFTKEDNGEFTKKDIDLFKGISQESLWEELRGKQQELFEFFARELDLYAKQEEMKFGMQKMDIHDFPFRITQRIIDGRRFFEMIAHYQKMKEDYIKQDYSEHKLFKENDILRVINTYNYYARCTCEGDKHVRMVFDCLFLYYIDTFGHEKIADAIEKIFIWAYRLRLQQKPISFASIKKYIRENENPFNRLKEKPGDFLNYDPPAPKKPRYKIIGIDELEDLFESMGKPYE